MKQYILAAGALLLGTSALAYAPGTEAEKGWSSEDKLVVAKTSHQLKDSTLDVLADAGLKAQPAGAATWSDVDKTKAPEFAAKSDGWNDGEARLISASAVTWQEPEPAAEADPDMDLAATPVDEAPLDTPVETAAPVTIASADLTTRPAADNYPPCAPGPGDDRCIQLYEPGVRMALASWNQPTGGLADGSATTAMGGPYEPVDGAADSAMNGDGMVDAAIGETAEAETTGL